MEQEMLLPKGSGEEVSLQVATETPAQKLRKTPEPGTAERRNYDRIRQQEHRERKAAKKQIESLKYTSKLELTKKEALELLAERIRNPHVREVCYDLAT